MKKTTNQLNPEQFKRIWELKMPNQIRANFNLNLYLKILKLKLHDNK